MTILMKSRQEGRWQQNGHGQPSNIPSSTQQSINTFVHAYVAASRLPIDAIILLSVASAYNTPRAASLQTYSCSTSTFHEPLTDIPPLMSKGFYSILHEFLATGPVDERSSSTRSQSAPASNWQYLQQKQQKRNVTLFLFVYPSNSSSSSEQKKVWRTTTPGDLSTNKMDPPHDPVISKTPRKNPFHPMTRRPTANISSNSVSSLMTMSQFTNHCASKQPTTRSRPTPSTAISIVINTKTREI